MFSEKSEYLMKLTNTQNSKLAHAINLVAAHISRLRSRQRALPKNPSFIKPLCNYLSKQITMEYRKKALCDILGTEVWKPSYPEIDGRTAIMATLYNSGTEQTNPNPQPNDFGTIAKDNYYYMRRLLGLD